MTSIRENTEVCHRWQKSKTCSYGDACKCLHDSKAALPHPKYENPLLRPFPRLMRRMMYWITTILGTEIMMKETVRNLPTSPPMLLPEENGSPKVKGKSKRKGKGKGGGEKGTKARSGKWFSQRVPCKYHAFGNCAPRDRTVHTFPQLSSNDRLEQSLSRIKINLQLLWRRLKQL